MSKATRTARVVALVVAASCALTACTAPAPRVVEGSVVRVAVAEPLTSLAPQLIHGSGSTNEAVAAITHSRFFDYRFDGQLQEDLSFGRSQIVDGPGFAVEYTIAEGVTWSDGVPVDGVDLLLAWVVGSGARNTVEASSDTSAHGEVFFEGEDADALAQARTVLLGSNGRSLTLQYDSVIPDWKLAFEVGAPAHVLARLALGIEDPEEAKAAVQDAILSSDDATLSTLSQAWNSAFEVDGAVVDDLVLVSNGPYTVSRVAADAVTLVANPLYTGERRPFIETVELSVIPDPMKRIDALSTGAVDAISTDASPEDRSALLELGATVMEGFDNTYEHLDLQFSESKSGHFDDPLVREAFLLAVPRDLIAEAAGAFDGQPRSSFVFMPGTDEYAAAVAVNGSEAYSEADPQGARTLLDEAGLVSPEVCILYSSDVPGRVRTFQLIQESAAAAGFVVTDCSQPDIAATLGKSGAYDAALFGWNSPYLATSTSTQLLSSVGGATNLNRYSSAAMDALLTTLQGVQEPDARTATLGEIDALLWADAYGLPLYQHRTVTVFSDRVAGVAPSPFVAGLLWGVWDWEPLA